MHTYRKNAHQSYIHLILVMGASDMERRHLTVNPVAWFNIAQQSVMQKDGIPIWHHFLSDGFGEGFGTTFVLMVKTAK